MESEYSVKEIAPRTFMIEETRGAFQVWMYLIEGDEKAILIDTGLGNLDVGAIAASLTKKPVEVINTHCHGDHIGGNGDFSKIYLSPKDRKGYLDQIAGNAPGRLVRPVPTETVDIRDGDEFDLGGRTLRIIETPGHSPGSVSILDVENRILFTGDCCCRGEILAFSEEDGITGYRDTMKKILAMGDQFDETRPAHVESPVGKDVLERILQLAEDVVAGKIEEKPYEHSFFKGKMCAYRDELGIVYPKLDR